MVWRGMYCNTIRMKILVSNTQTREQVFQKTNWKKRINNNGGLTRNKWTKGKTLSNSKIYRWSETNSPNNQWLNTKRKWRGWKWNQIKKLRNKIIKNRKRIKQVKLWVENGRIRVGSWFDKTPIVCSWIRTQLIDLKK